MGEFLGSKIGKVSILLSGLILTGIAAFSAVKIYQLKKVSPLQCGVDTPSIYCQQPPEPAKCTGLTISNQGPKIGDIVTATCTGVPTSSLSKAEFQLSINGDSYKNIQNKTSNTTQIEVSQAGTYTVRCRWCATGDSTNCSAWQTL